MNGQTRPEPGLDSHITAESESWIAFLGAGRLHITAIAALGVFTFGWLFTGHYQWLLTAVVAVDWFVVNLTNRIVDVEEDSANAIRATGFVVRHRRVLLTGLIAVLLVSLIVVHFLNPAITILRIAGHLLGLFYNFPLLPGRRRLKQLYFWKNTASAMGFMITVIAYPLATMIRAGDSFPPGIGWSGVAFSAAFFFLFEISYEVIYDLRDVAGDARLSVRTYPVVHGVTTAVRITDGLILGAMVVLAAGYVLGVLPWRIFIMIAAPIFQLIVYKRALRRGITPRDCISLTWLGAAQLFVYHLWVIAGLPGVGL